MSDDPREAAQEGAPNRFQPQPLSPWVTTLCAVLTGGYLAVAAVTAPSSPLDRLEFPEESLERLVTREMDIRQALQSAPEWKRTLYEAFAGGEDSLADALGWYDELIGAGPSPVAHLYRVVLMAEEGRSDRVSAALVPWEFQGESAFRMAQWVRAAYLGASFDKERGPAVLEEIQAELPPGWFADVLTARVAAGLGDAAAKRAAESAIRVRGESLLDRWIVLIAVQLVLLCLGGAMLVKILFKRAGVSVGEAPLPPFWTSRDGYGLFIRGACGYLLIGLAASYAFPKESPFSGVATLAAGLPLVWWLVRYLSARGASLPATFGLRLRPGSPARLAAMTCVVVGLSVMGETVISIASSVFHLKPHWADGLLENVLWGQPWLVGCDLLDSVVWAPVIEELAFRGVLYATLRMTIGVWPAVGASAAVFAAVHGYGTLGFVSVLWSGMLWAWAYERSRSLLPGILGHMVNNLLVTTEFIWLLRM